METASRTRAASLSAPSGAWRLRPRRLPEAGDGVLGALVPFAAFSNGFYFGKEGVALVATGREPGR